MATFTVGCTESGCFWEEDRDYDDLQEAQDDIESECCPKGECYGDLRVS